MKLTESEKAQEYKTAQEKAPWNGKEINIITFNDNSTISASSTINLNGATTLELRKGARRTAKMVYYDKIWYLL